MFGSLAGDLGACPHLVARTTSAASQVMGRRRRGVFMPDALVPHKEGKSKGVPRCKTLTSLML